MANDFSAPYGEPEAAPWAPSEAVRGRLLLGAVAVLASVGLTAAGLGATLLDAKAGGFNIGRALEWAAVLPQLGVLAALLALARESQSRGLWKSSVGLLGVSCLGLMLDLAADEHLAKQVRISAGIATAVGMLVLLIMACGNWPKFADPNAKGGTSPQPANKGMGWLAGILVPIVLIGARIFAKGFRRMKLNGEQLLGIEACILIVLLLVFLIWFAWTKIRLAEKFGKVSFLLGSFELFALLAAIGAMGSFFAVAAPSITLGNDAEVARLGELWGKGVMLAGIAGCVVWGALCAWLFLSVRKLGERDWRFEFSENGARPWQ